MRKSFTLIELLLSVTIFTIIISVVLGMASFAIKIQTRNLSDQYMLNQVDYTIEYLSRQLRMAQRNDTGADIDTCQVDCTYNYDSVTNKISFIDTGGICQKVYLSNGKIYVSDTPITSDKFEISDFKVHLENPCKSDLGQPRITFTFTIKKKNSSEEGLQFQTTVSQRNLNL